VAALMADRWKIGEDELRGLLARWGQGDSQAADRVISAFSPRIYTFLLRFTGRQDVAEDLTQETFIRVVRSIGRYEHQGRFGAWLYRIAANLGRDYFRRASHQPSTPGMEVVLGRIDVGERGEDDGPEAKLLQKEAREQVVAAVGRLPLAERETVLLKHFSGLTFREISDVMQCPLGTALSRMHRALKRLEKLLG
jgi:RNA polymerase sigma-70 factor (ECF subfamily)